MPMEFGKVAAARMLRREAQAISADVTSLETTVNAITLIPVFAYAVGESTMHVRFTTELDYDPVDLDTSAWDVTIAANGGAPAALTTTGSVSGASGLVVLSFSGTPFKLPPEEEQAISLTYTPSGTNDLKDAAGRTVAGFTYNSILPRISDWRKAAYLLMPEQGSEPSAPAAGYSAVYLDTDPRINSKEPDGTNHSYAWVTDVTAGDATSLAANAATAAALADLQAGVEPFDPGALFFEQGADPATPAAGHWMAFFKAGGLYVIDDTGAVTGPFGTGGGSGDSISVNGSAATDADFDDATPAAGAGDLNIKWQKDAGSPNNISAYVDVSAMEPLVNARNLANAMQTALKTSDQTAIGTAYADVSGLGFSVSANKAYAFHYYLICDSDATTTGIDVAVNGPASPTDIHYEQVYWTSATARTERGATAYDNNTASTASNGTARKIFEVYGVLRNGANAGTLIPRAKREAVGSGPNVRAGSWGQLIPLD